MTMADEERRITRQWTDRLARYTYVLERWIAKPTGGYEPYWHKATYGDRDWALRIAAHYGMAVPGEGDD